MKAEEKIQYERIITELSAQLDAIDAITKGKEPSDFLLSFPTVRAVSDYLTLKGKIKCLTCGCSVAPESVLCSECNPSK